MGADIFSILGTLSPEELLDIAVRMAQELQDFCDEANQAGSPLPSVQGLVDEFNNDYFAKTQLSWMGSVTDKNVPGIAALQNNEME